MLGIFKKIILSFFISAFSLFFISIFLEPNNQLYSAVSLLFLLILIFMLNAYTFKGDNHKIDTIIGLVLSGITLILSIFLIDMFWTIILALVFVNTIFLLIKRYKILLFLLTLGLYPAIVFNVFAFNMTTVSIWVGYVFCTFSFSYYLKNKKTKIYLYDNY